MPHSLACLLSVLFLLLLSGQTALGQVSVINMVPVTRSGETNQDSEPTLAVNPSNPRQIVASAFTWDNLTGGPMTGANAPIYVSIDSGQTWSLVNNVPSAVGSTFPTGDITNWFSGTTIGTTNVMYTGILHAPEFSMRVYWTNDYRVATPLTQLDVRTNNVDQPHTQARTVLRGATGNDRVYVGFNNGYGGVAPQTATVDYSLNAGVASPTFVLRLIEARSTGTGGQDGFATMPAIHYDGTVYAAFFGWRGSSTMDIVVVRDDNWATGATPFSNLVDPGDSVVGARVVTGRTIPTGTLAQERVGSSSLSIAVDPRNSDRAYVAWLDLVSSTPTLHVRRSIDRGVNWSSSDLITVSSALNPALAINSMGKVGFLYQTATGTGASQRWQTVFRRTTDVDATVFDAGVTLANTPANTPTPAFQPYIGDYDYVVAVGRNFYGVFSANNTPDTANFVPGVVYQRYANFTTHTLFSDAAMTTPVAASIDPFFFRVEEVAAGDNFYVRDWTNSAADADPGAEPSTNPYFYVNSDVWNRRGTLPGSFPSDQPENEDAGNGAGTTGDNWAFARIRRNATSSGSQTVTAHFLVSRFGTGGPFVDSTSGDPNVQFLDPDPLVTFAAGDMGPQLAGPVHWQLATTASTHLCLAVEISSTNDPYVPPSLVGNTPGWPSTDLRIINDNNKAQRNMGLSTTPARGVGGSPSASVSYCAIAYNAATFPRDMELQYEITPEVARRFRNIRISQIGGQTVQPRSRVAAAVSNRLTLKGMQPGENRWICMDFTPPEGKEGEVFTVNFWELAAGTPVNGFAVGARLASSARVFHDALELHRSEFTRLAYGFRLEEARRLADTAKKLRDTKEISASDYLAFLREHLPAMDKVVRAFVQTGGGDALGAMPVFTTLQKNVKSAAAEASAMAHTAFLNRLDSLITMRQLAQGDAASVVLNVRWQMDLYTRVPQLAKLECAGRLRAVSERFLDGVAARRIAAKTFPDLVSEVEGCLASTARANSNLDLEKDLQEMRQSRGDLAALQRSHRNYLLKVQGLDR